MTSVKPVASDYNYYYYFVATIGIQVMVYWLKSLYFHFFTILMVALNIDKNLLARVAAIGEKAIFFC